MDAKKYLRQTSLKGFGKQAQQKLLDAKVVVIGLGGLGIPVVQYLNAMGVGTIGLVEQDTVEISNLHRQVIYRQEDIGKSKGKLAREWLEKQNPDTNLILHHSFLSKENAMEILKEYDLVIDATDNFPSRYLINDACQLLKKPLVYGALHAFEGHLSVFHYSDGPTYRCLFPQMPEADEIPDCNTNGVLGILPGIIGNFQALEAVKILTGIGEVMSGKLMIYNSLNNAINFFEFKKDSLQTKRTELEESYTTPGCHTNGQLSIEQLQQLILDQPSPQIIDVREAWEYEEFSLQPSLNIPLNQLRSRKNEIDKDRPCYLLCASGKRSAIARNLLAGFFPHTEILHLTGGLRQHPEFSPQH